MKPIIIEMDEMTDSAQIYHANIHPVVIRLIYIVLGLMCAAILWMYFSRLETVIKAQGQMVYRETDGDGALMHVTSDVGGTYYAEIYIKAADISSLKKGQKVKLTLASYPSGEYGAVTGYVENIVKNLLSEDGQRTEYYVVRVKCEENNAVLQNIEQQKGELGLSVDGMNCEAKIITGRQRIIRYILSQIGLAV